MNGTSNVARAVRSRTFTECSVPFQRSGRLVKPAGSAGSVVHDEHVPLEVELERAVGEGAVAHDAVDRLRLRLDDRQRNALAAQRADLECVRAARAPQGRATRCGVHGLAVGHDAARLPHTRAIEREVRRAAVELQLQFGRAVDARTNRRFAVAAPAQRHFDRAVTAVRAHESGAAGDARPAAHGVAEQHDELDRPSRRDVERERVPVRHERHARGAGGRPGFELVERDGGVGHPFAATEDAVLAHVDLPRRAAQHGKRGRVGRRREGGHGRECEQQACERNGETVGRGHDEVLGAFGSGRDRTHALARRSTSA
jgi:hypothetical protein